VFFVRPERMPLCRLLRRRLYAQRAALEPTQAMIDRPAYSARLVRTTQAQEVDLPRPVSCVLPESTVSAENRPFPATFLLDITAQRIIHRRSRLEAF